MLTAVAVVPVPGSAVVPVGPPVEAALVLMERQLGERSWCHGIHLSLADVALGCALGYLDFRFPQLAWRERHPRLLKLHDKLMTRPSFADTRPPQ